MSQGDKVIERLRNAGMYDGLFATKLARAPRSTKKDLGVGDVHVASTGKKPETKKKPSLDFNETVRRVPANTVNPGDGEMGKASTEFEDNLDFETTFEVVKADSDQRLIFGWASVAAIGGKMVIDKQGDIIPVEELEKAAYDFALYARQQGHMHDQVGVGRAVEMMVFTPEKAKLGLVAKNEAGQTIYGFWVGFHVDDDAVWKDHKAGKLPEFSIGGRAQSEEVEVDD